MDVTFLWYDFFSCFLFYQELRTLKNYIAFRFSLNHKKLISLRRITFFYVKCRCSIKICSFSFFRIWSAIAQPITSDLDGVRQLSAPSSDLNSMCSCICISRLPHCPWKTPRPEIKLFIAHIATAGKWYLRKIYILVARFIFDDSAMVVFKRRIRIEMSHWWAEKIRSDACWSNMFPCVSGRVVVDYGEFD